MTTQKISQTLQDQLTFAIDQIPGNKLTRGARLPLHIIRQIAVSGLASLPEANRLAKAMNQLQVKKLIEESNEKSLLADHWKDSDLVDRVKAALTMSGSDIKSASKSAQEKPKTVQRLFEQIARGNTEPTEEQTKTCEQILSYLSLPEYQYGLD